jgi:rubrerythrin
MEKEEIGTKATRAAIIETLQERKYLMGTDKLTVSDLGFEVTEVLEKYCPTVVSSDMTRSLEEKMEAIQRGKETKYTVLADAMERLKVVTSELKSKEFAVGAQLTQALQRSKPEHKGVGTCPNCKGQLVLLLQNPPANALWDAATSLKPNAASPIPCRRRNNKPLTKPCPSCGAPVVSVLREGKRALAHLYKPQCSSKGAVPKS